MSGISIGIETMYEEQQLQQERNKGKSYTVPVALLTIGAVGALMPTPMNLYVWGAGATGLIVAKGLEGKVA